VSVVDIGENYDAKLGMWVICSAKVGDVASILEKHAGSSTWSHGLYMRPVKECLKM